MSLKTRAVDAGTGSTQKVDSTGAARIVSRGLPPVDKHDDSVIVFRQYFTDDGLSTGSEDMLVDGSGTAAEFWIPADTDDDRYIVTVNFALAGDAADLSSFISAAQGELTNGVNMHYHTGFSEVVIHEGLKDNLDVIRLAGGQPAFGDGATAHQFPGLGPAPAKVNGYLPVMDLRQVFGVPWGVRLRAGTTQKLVLKVQDDLTHADNEQFNAIAYGYDRIPD